MACGRVHVGTGRLKAFSDSVIAFILTIRVLELKVPTEHTLEDLWPPASVMLSYVPGLV